MTLNNGTGSDAGIGSRAAKGTGGAGRKKGGRKKGSKDSGGGTVHKLTRAAAGGDLSAAAALERIFKCWELRVKADANAAKVQDETKKSMDAAESAFRDKMETPLEANAPEKAAAERLREIEGLWEEFNEEIDTAKTKRQAAKDKLKKAVKAFQEAMDEGVQPNLFPLGDA